MLQQPHAATNPPHAVPPAAPHGLPPVILRSQLSSMLRDSTELEKELDELRRGNVIRLFRMCTGKGRELAEAGRAILHPPLIHPGQD